VEACLSAEGIRYLEKIINSGDWISFHHILAYWRLQQNKELSDLPFALWLLDNFYKMSVAQTSFKENMDTSFLLLKVLRKLAYVSLDLDNTDKVCTLHLEGVILSLEKGVDDTLQWGRISDNRGLLLHSLEKFLYGTLYMTQHVARNNVAFLELYRQKYKTISWDQNLRDCFEKSTLEIIRVSEPFPYPFFLTLQLQQESSMQMKYCFSLPYLHVNSELKSYRAFQKELAKAKSCSDYSRFFVSSFGAVRTPICQIDFFGPIRGGKNAHLGKRVYPILEAIYSQSASQDLSLYDSFDNPVVFLSQMFNSFARFLFGTVFRKVPEMVELVRSAHKVPASPWRLVKGVGEAIHAFGEFNRLQSQN